MCSQVSHISITNDTQKAGSSDDGIQYYLMLVKQNPHKHTPQFHRRRLQCVSYAVGETTTKPIQ